MYRRTGNELKHYGVLGMKWGRRKHTAGDYNNYSSVTRSLGEASNSAANTVRIRGEQRRAKLNRKSLMDVQRLSDDDLRRAINRMDMERRYSELVTQRNVGRGQQRIESTLRLIGAMATTSSAVIGVASTVMKLKGTS